MSRVARRSGRQWRVGQCGRSFRPEANQRDLWAILPVMIDARYRLAHDSREPGGRQ